MRNGTDELTGGIPGELGVGIEGEDVANVFEYGDIADFHGKTIGAATQKFVEVEKFATFAFPTHPGIFHFVEAAVTVELKEAVAGVDGVTRIQFRDEFRAEAYQFVFFIDGKWRVRCIGEENETKIRIAIAEVADFQIAGQVADLFF